MSPDSGTPSERTPCPNEHEFDHEPVHGLPVALPEGEVILWQGSPSWRALLWGAFGLRLVLLYFAAFAVWRVVSMWADDTGIEAIAIGVLALLPLVIATGAILALMAWGTARAAVYTITTRRVAMRIGLVTTVTLNLPYRWIGSAALRQSRNGTGDIALSLLGRDRLAYLMLWPHVRPWALRKAEPALRGLESAGPVAELLARTMRKAQEHRLAMEEAAGGMAPAVTPGEAEAGGVRPPAGQGPMAWMVPAE